VGSRLALGVKSREAERERVKLLHDLDKERYTDRSKMTLAEYLRDQ